MRALALKYGVVEAKLLAHYYFTVGAKSGESDWPALTSSKVTGLRCSIPMLLFKDLQSEVAVLSRKPRDCAIRAGKETLPQVKEFKYLRYS